MLNSKLTDFDPILLIFYLHENFDFLSQIGLLKYDHMYVVLNLILSPPPFTLFWGGSRTEEWNRWLFFSCITFYFFHSAYDAVSFLCFPICNKMFASHLSIVNNFIQYICFLVLVENDLCSKAGSPNEELQCSGYVYPVHVENAQNLYVVP